MLVLPQLTWFRRHRRVRAIAIDLGTANTLVHGDTGGILVDEPSLVAVERTADGTEVVRAAGREALRLIGQRLGTVEVRTPIRDGVVADVPAATAMLECFLRAAIGRSEGFRRVVVSLPRDASPAEREDFRRVAEALGPREISLVYEPIAAALGGGLDVRRPRGQLMIDIGSGITEAVAISGGHVVAHRAMRRGGEELDREIAAAVQGEYGLRIASDMAEALKLRLGAAALAGDDAAVARARGRSVASDLPHETAVRAGALRDIFARFNERVFDLVVGVLAQVAPALVSDIVDDGVWLSGGPTLLRGADARLAATLCIPVHRVADPLRSVVLGGGLVLGDRALREVTAL